MLRFKFILHIVIGSELVTPHIHFNILISKTFISYPLFNAQNSDSHIIADPTTVL